MSTETDRTEALRRELVRGLVEETGMREVLALPIANSLVAFLQRERSGQYLYVPSPTRQHDRTEMRAALERGEAPAQVCRKFAIGRRTLDRIFPGGLPKPSSRVAQPLRRPEAGYEKSHSVKD